jgi:hypothetical protein
MGVLALAGVCQVSTSPFFLAVKLVVSRNMSEERGGGTLDCRSSIVGLSDSNAEELNGLALEAGPLLAWPILRLVVADSSSL